MPRLLKILTPLLLVLSLTGCFKSGAPLLDATQAKYPFATISLRNEEGELSLVKRDGDVYRFIEEGKQDKAALLIHELGPDLYLVQVATPEGEAEYLFARKQESDLIVRSDCKGLDPAMLRGQGVEVQETSENFLECQFSTLQSLVDLGKSPGIWANSTTTLKIVSIE
jgi:hypothetical protein